MRSRTTVGVATISVTLGLLAAACGSSTPKPAATNSAVTTAAPTTAPGTTAPPSTAAAASFGKAADGTYRGAGNFVVDPKKCPADWNAKQGITDASIDLFTSLPKSGPLAGYGLIADGMSSYFKYVNDNGGIGGRTINLTAKDDVYDPKQTKANSDEALAAKKYAAYVAVLGTPNNLAIWDSTNAECMPQLLDASGAAQWGDVENHPWTTGEQIDYTTEASLWAAWLVKQFPNGAKVAMLTYDNDFGLSYSKGFRTAAKGSKLEVVKEVKHQAAAANLTNEITTLADTKADVVLVQTTGAFCTQAMAELEKGAWHPVTILSATCASLGQYFAPLIKQGLTGKDVYEVQTFKDVNDPAYATDDFVKLFHATAKAQGLDDKQSTYATGWIFAWYMTEILRAANGYVGGLDRGNIMVAARSIAKTVPLALDGLTSKMSGLDDAYLIEGGRVAQYKVTDPTQLGSFQKVTDVIDLDGKLGTYTKFNAKAVTG